MLSDLLKTSWKMFLGERVESGYVAFLHNPFKVMSVATNSQGILKH